MVTNNKKNIIFYFTIYDNTKGVNTIDTLLRYLYKGCQ